MTSLFASLDLTLIDDSTHFLSPFNLKWKRCKILNIFYQIFTIRIEVCLHNLRRRNLIIARYISRSILLIIYYLILILRTVVLRIAENIRTIRIRKYEYFHNIFLTL